MNIGMREWLLILVVVLLLFGAKRLPDMARGIGRSLRILKAETRGLRDDETPDTHPDAGQASPGRKTDRPTEDLPPSH